MEAISLIISKFSTEIIQVQLAALCLFGSTTLYWFLIKRRQRQNSEWVPAAIVKEYLDRAAEDERQTRYRLFGVYAPQAQGQPLTAHIAAPMATPVMGAAPVAGVSMDPGLLRELEALRLQLANADKRGAEFDKTLITMKEERALLEQKLKDAEANKGSGGGTVDAGATKELEDLRARLKEYEIIEDDLASLKKFQAENKELKEKLAAMGGGAKPAAVAAAPAPAPVAAVAPAAAAPAAPMAAVDSAPKKEAELLSEFEKMLAS